MYVWSAKVRKTFTYTLLYKKYLRKIIITDYFEEE